MKIFRIKPEISSNGDSRIASFISLALAEYIRSILFRVTAQFSSLAGRFGSQFHHVVQLYLIVPRASAAEPRSLLHMPLTYISPRIK